MKILYKIFLVSFLLFVVATAFPFAVKATCTCSCTPKKNLVSESKDMDQNTQSVCGQATSNVTLPEQTDADACQKACAALPAPGGVGTPPCYNASGQSTCGSGSTAACWCDAGSGAYHKSDTASQSDCQTTCTGLNQKFVAWSNAGPPQAASANAAPCPPGGDWTSTNCATAKNEDGTLIGVWKPPNGETKGPYCFYNNAPIKLGVGLGTLTQANIAQYLAAAYQLGLGIAAALAVIFIMIGGFRYLSAAGGSGVEQGKEMIKNAVIGLVLAALSYTLLQTVNPDLLSLRLPSVQLIKQCSIKPVDCGSRDSTTCEKNSADSSQRCSWNAKLSICQDLSMSQSGTAGQVGGPCKVDASGNKTCDLGDCVVISSNEAKCSQFAKCQACQNDTTYDSNGAIATRLPQQCNANGGYPVKCIDHMCADINSNNPPKSGTTPTNDNYISCTNGSCSTDANCPANQKCNDNHVCIVANQGTTGCTSDGDCRIQDGQKCVKQQTAGGWITACCANGDPNGCLGCSSDSSCSNGTFCLMQSRVSLTQSSSPFDPSMVGKCVNGLSAGSPCDGDKMCLTGQCINNKCSSAVKIYPCDAATIKPLIDRNIIKNADEFCQTQAGGGLGAGYTCNIYGQCSNGTATYSP